MWLSDAWSRPLLTWSAVLVYYFTIHTYVQLVDAGVTDAVVGLPSIGAWWCQVVLR